MRGMEKMDFVVSVFHPCLFFKGNQTTNDLLIVSVATDDLLRLNLKTEQARAAMQKFKAEIPWPMTHKDNIDEVLGDLSLMLTAGRLGDVNKAIIKSAMQNEFLLDRAKAVRIAQQLITASPEFHSTNVPRKEGGAREIKGYTHLSKHKYKAVVYLML